MTRDLPPYRVDVLTKDFGIMQPENTGLPCAVQAARVVVTDDVESRSHVVVRVTEALWSASIALDQLRALFPGDFVSCIRSDSLGCAEISCLAGSETELQGAAAAVATLQRAWGWDESAVIAVRFSETQLAVTTNPQFENNAWTVAVT